MIARIFSHVTITGIVLLLAVSCSDGGHIAGPIGPTTGIEGASGADSGLIAGAGEEVGWHYLWAYHLVFFDPANNSMQLVPIRQSDAHWNVIKFLEQEPCADCINITKIKVNTDGTVDFDVMLRHPFQTPNFTGFDVRGIVMFNGSHLFPSADDIGLYTSDHAMSDGQLVNADGFTTLYNPTTAEYAPFEGYLQGKYATLQAPNAQLNGYKRFITDPSKPRAVFAVGGKVTVTYKVYLPQNPIVFGYAVDASWVPPVHQPVTDPWQDFGPNANCQEAWQISICEAPGGNLTQCGGSTTLIIDIYDWQGKDLTHDVLVECPELFEDDVIAAWKEDSAEYTRYEATIENAHNADIGSYMCLIGKREDPPSGKPWMDLTAYQIFMVEVTEDGEPSNPVDVTPSWLNMKPESITVSGKILYVGSEVNGLQIFDISNPSSPVILKTIETTYYTYDMAVSNGYAYVAGSYPGLLVIDIEPIEDAHITNTVSILNARGVAVSGGYAYVADSPSGLQIIDIDPPETAHIVKTVDTPGYAMKVAVAGGYAYVADKDAGLQIIKIDPLDTASIVNSIDTPSDAYDVAISEGCACVAGFSGPIYLVDITQPETAYIIKTVHTTGNANGVASSGGYAYVADGDGGLQIVDIDPPEEAQLINTVDTGNWPVDVAVSGGYAYVAGTFNLLTIDIDPPETAYITSSFETSRAANDVVVSDGYAYVTDMLSTELQIIDIDPVEAAFVVKDVKVPYLPYQDSGLTVSGGYAYIANGYYNGIYIIDIDPPETAHLAKTVYTSPSYWTFGVAVSDGYAYVTWVSAGGGEKGGLFIIDIDPIGTAQLVKVIDTPSRAMAVDIQGGYAYVADYSAGLQIIDISSIETASVIKEVDTSGLAYGVDVSGGYAYIADYWSGLQVIDIDPPETAYIVSTVDTPGCAYDVTVSGGYAFIAWGEEDITGVKGGLQVIDVNAPEAAYFYSKLDWPHTEAFGVDISCGYAYLADGQGDLDSSKDGLRIIKLW